MTFRDRLAYDADAGTYHDGAMRYIFLKPEALMGVVLQMPEDQRPAVLEAMARSIFLNGGKSAKSYEAAGATAAADLLAVICSTAGQLGWGKWSATLDDTALRLSVEGSPFAAAYGPSDTPVCAPITGMLRAVSGMVFGVPTQVEELTCAAMSAPLCTFEARPA